MIGIISRYREKFYRAHHHRPLIALISLDVVEPLEGEPQVIACMSVKYRDSSFTSFWYGCCSVPPNMNEQRRHRINGTMRSASVSGTWFALGCAGAAATYSF